MRMRTSSLRARAKPLRPTTARAAVIINQCATPGLGSLMAGRKLAGVGQLALSCIGFALILAWFTQLFIELYSLMNDATWTKPFPWTGRAGALVFLAAWLWSGFTSLSILREAKHDEGPSYSDVPPKIPT